MEVSRAKFVIGRDVEYNGTIYTLTAIYTRSNGRAFYHQAELKDKNAQSSLVIAPLSEVNEIKQEV